MTKERKAWIPPLPAKDPKVDPKEQFEEALAEAYKAIERSRLKTEEIRQEYREKAAAL